MFSAALLALLLAGCASVASAVPSGGSASQPAQPAASPPAAGASPSSALAAPSPQDNQLRVSKSGWTTDFSRHTVPLSEIASGGPGKDGIPAIDKPKMVSLKAGDAFLKPKEAVVAFEHGGEARAYPIQIMVWHEIVNDVVGGDPVTVTFCPLCNTAIAFDRRLEGRVLDFGTTGNLRNSDLVMYDRQTESWWQQAEGQAIVGQLAGRKLTFLPTEVVSWAEFKSAFPRGQVLSRDTGFNRPYGNNPYVGYDRPDSSPFLFQGKPDGRLKPMERVLTLELNGQDKAYPFAALASRRVVMDHVGGQPVAIFFQPGVSSALDGGTVAGGRDVGAAAAFDPRLDGRELRFQAKAGSIVDGSGSTWDIFGRAIAGPAAGKQLKPVVSGTHFWFAWAAFKPATTLYAG
ncbi:MAG: DUF3179 domain-containing protein [Chloroflexota bacterium]|nr:DUF3179 domain-containing protein [Chloroflexota bacterium]